MASMSLFALTFKAEVRRGPTHKAFQSFRSFPKRRVPPGARGLGKDVRPGTRLLQGYFSVCGYRVFSASVPSSKPPGTRWRLGGHCPHRTCPTK